MGLYLYRRHLKHGFGKDKKQPCPNSEDRFAKKGDKCPVWVEGVDPQGTYHRKSLKTTSWDIGEKLMRDMLLPPPPKTAAPASAPTVASSIATFMANLTAEGRTRGTVRKYEVLLASLQEFATLKGIDLLADLTFEHLIAFRKTWSKKHPATQNKELDRLKAFYSMCHAEGWVAKNSTKRMKPAAVDTAMPDPFTKEEQATILEKPQIRRHRCFVNVMYYSALRISDCCMLRPQDFDGANIRRVNKKNKKVVFIPIPASVKKELDRLSLVGGYYFLIGQSTHVGTQTDAWRTVLNDLFKEDLPGFHPHRFRHTAAVNWLTGNPPLTIEEVAALLGSSVKVVEKHYATWCGARQQTVADKLAKVWGI